MSELQISRRNFLKGGAATLGAMGLGGLLLSGEPMTEPARRYVEDFLSAQSRSKNFLAQNSDLERRTRQIFLYTPLQTSIAVSTRFFPPAADVLLFDAYLNEMKRFGVPLNDEGRTAISETVLKKLLATDQVSFTELYGIDKVLRRWPQRPSGIIELPRSSHAVLLDVQRGIDVPRTSETDFKDEPGQEFVGGFTYPDRHIEVYADRDTKKWGRRLTDAEYKKVVAYIYAHEIVHSIDVNYAMMLLANMDDAEKRSALLLRQKAVIPFRELWESRYISYTDPATGPADQLDTLQRIPNFSLTAETLERVVNQSKIYPRRVLQAITKSTGLYSEDISHLPIGKFLRSTITSDSKFSPDLPEYDVVDYYGYPLFRDDNTLHDYYIKLWPKVKEAILQGQFSNVSDNEFFIAICRRNSRFLADLVISMESSSTLDYRTALNNIDKLADYLGESGTGMLIKGEYTGSLSDRVSSTFVGSLAAATQEYLAEIGGTYLYLLSGFEPNGERLIKEMEGLGQVAYVRKVISMLDEKMLSAITQRVAGLFPARTKLVQEIAQQVKSAGIPKIVEVV